MDLEGKALELAEGARKQIEIHFPKLRARMVKALEDIYASSAPDGNLKWNFNDFKARSRTWRLFEEMRVNNTIALPDIRKAWKENQSWIHKHEAAENAKRAAWVLSAEQAVLSKTPEAKRPEFQAKIDDRQKKFQAEIAKHQERAQRAEADIARGFSQNVDHEKVPRMREIIANAEAVRLRSQKEFSTVDATRPTLRANVAEKRKEELVMRRHQNAKTTSEERKAAGTLLEAATEELRKAEAALSNANETCIRLKRHVRQCEDTIAHWEEKLQSIGEVIASNRAAPPPAPIRAPARTPPATRREPPPKMEAGQERANPSFQLEGVINEVFENFKTELKKIKWKVRGNAKGTIRRRLLLGGVVVRFEREKDLRHPEWATISFTIEKPTDDKGRKRIETIIRGALHTEGFPEPAPPPPSARRRENIFPLTQDLPETELEGPFLRATAETENEVTESINRPFVLFRDITYIQEHPDSAQAQAFKDGKIYKFIYDRKASSGKMINLGVYLQWDETNQSFKKIHPADVKGADIRASGAEFYLVYGDQIPMEPFAEKPDAEN